MLNIATVATHDERYLPVLDKQIKDKGEELVKLGFGKKYYGHIMKDKEMIDYLKDLDKDQIVVFVDGFDTLCLGTSEEIVKKFKKMDKKLVISIENIGYLSFIHSAIFNRVRGKYINTGLYIGYAGFMKDFLTKMYEYEHVKKSNQKNWSDFLFKNAWRHFDLNDIGLDVDNELFLNYSFSVSDRYIFDGDRIIANGVHPSFIQGNGCTNMNDIIKRNGYKTENINAEKIFSEGVRYSIKAIFSTYAPILNLYIYLLVLIIIIICYTVYINFIQKNKNKLFN